MVARGTSYARGAAVDEVEDGVRGRLRRGHGRGDALGASGTTTTDQTAETARMAEAARPSGIGVARMAALLAVPPGERLRQRERGQGRGVEKRVWDFSPSPRERFVYCRY